MKHSPLRLEPEQNKWLSPFAKLDHGLLTVVSLLIILAVVNFYSITHSPQSDLSPIFWKHLFRILIGIALFAGLSFINYKIFSRFSYIFYILNLSALVLVLFFGKTFNGAKRWFDFGLFSYQPAETMQLALILVLSHLFSRKAVHHVYGFVHILPVFVLTVLPMALISWQPDLGTALLLGIQSLTLVFFLKLSRRVWVSFFACLLVAVPAMWFFALKDYQKSRVLTFISVNEDPQGAGYNTIQSKIAVGSGMVFGRGFQKGSQTRLEFLPERHTDFVFSVLSEEHGFIGSLTTLILFFILILKILKIAGRSRDKTGAYLSLGCLSVIFWHIFINIGMAVGLLPIVGVPLPLLSYGGSNIVTTFLALGLVSSVFSHRYMYS